MINSMDITNQKRILNRCGITNIEEVHYDGFPRIRVFAKLGDFTFRHQNYYWVASGKVPIKLAVEFFEDIVGKTDIRSSGHCGCPHPMDHGVKWIAADGRQVISANQQAEFERLEHLGGDFLPEVVQKSYIFHDDPESIGAEGFVDFYHIDSELGLYLFVQGLLDYNLGD